MRRDKLVQLWHEWVTLHDYQNRLSDEYVRLVRFADRKQEIADINTLLVAVRTEIEDLRLRICDLLVQSDE
jgi:hypothetical protein